MEGPPGSLHSSYMVVQFGCTIW